MTSRPTDTVNAPPVGAPPVDGPPTRAAVVAPNAPRRDPPDLHIRRVLRAGGALLGALWFCSLLFSQPFATRLLPAAERTLYFKLPLEGVEFHWEFMDAASFLAGELTLRILDGEHDDTLVIFRDGVIQPGWSMIGREREDGRFYFGFASSTRHRTSFRDSLILTLTAPQDLAGIGPEREGVLRAGTWQMTGTYGSIYGGRFNPMDVIIRAGGPPVAYLTCWRGAWPIETTVDTGWMGPQVTGDKERSPVKAWLPDRGVDGRRCRAPV